MEITSNPQIFKSSNSSMRIYFLLGSNEGDRLGYLREAAASLVRGLNGREPHFSAVYETAAWGLEEQPAFLNQAISLETGADPEAALNMLRSVEAAAERQRTVRWGQRTLDVDILLYGEVILDSPELQIPHPQLRNRRFALVPLAEIAGGLLHPVLRKTISELLEICPDQLPVTRLSGVSESETESL